MQNELRELLGKFPKRRIVVFGDLIADEFLYGYISRVSREAPVLVVQYRDLVRLPGGAANAANNLLALGCRVEIVGAVGSDSAGDALLGTLRRGGAEVSRVARISGYATPVKTRILAGAQHSAPQQVVRLDRISALEGSELSIDGTLLGRILRDADGVILSDYGYGVLDQVPLTELRRICAERSIPLVADSRFRMSEFTGITALTPNITELEAATQTAIGADPSSLERVGRRVLRRQKLECLLVTQGRFGMTLLQRRKPAFHIPIFGTDEVADVTGAGDTVIAVFAAALASGATPGQAARLANYAGGIVVMKRGTATVGLQELLAAVAQDAGK